MTTLDLDRPLAGILDACRAAGRPLSQRGLAARRERVVSQEAVSAAIRAGAEIRLSTLAAYARAAGYALLVGCGGPPARRWNVTADGRASGCSVGELRYAIAQLGFEMTLTVDNI